MTKIAFCGPNGDLNQSLIEWVRDQLYVDQEWVEIEHPMIKVTEMSGLGPEYWNGPNIDWGNMWGASIRRMDLAGARSADIVVSASCGIDQVCLQATWLGEQVELQKRSTSLLGPSGEEILNDSGVWINRSGSVLQALLNSAEEEVHDWWDYVYAIIPVGSLPDSPYVPLIAQYHDFLKSVPSFQSVMKLPENFDAAIEVITSQGEVEKWKTHAS